MATLIGEMVTFLRARLDEREKRVRERHSRHCATDPDDTIDADGRPMGPVACDCDVDVTEQLRDVEAKRRIVEDYERALDRRRAHPDDLASAGALLALLGVVKCLAVPHSDHLNYREEWRP